MNIKVSCKAIKLFTNAVWGEEMYLISIYFDEETNKKIQGYINAVAKSTGNTYMIEGKVPPHITISSIEAKRESEDQIVRALEESAKKLIQGKLQWVSVGTFLPYVMYLTPVLNEYLHGLTSVVYGSLLNVDKIRISQYYRPFQWLPHTTIGKKMSQEEMRKAFEVMQNQFVPFTGKVTKIGLAKTNPYREIVTFELKENGELTK